MDFVKPHKSSALLVNFFFIVSKGGPKEKCWKIAKTIYWFLAIFPLVPPWKLWKKSCLKELKFGEVSRNPKSSICWKFQLFISLGSKKSPFTIQSWLKLNKPFWSRLLLTCSLKLVKANIGIRTTRIQNGKKWDLETCRKC